MFNVHTPYCTKNFRHLISQAFTHNMALKHIFGETPAIKMLDFLIDHIGYDYSKTQDRRTRENRMDYDKSALENSGGMESCDSYQKDRAGNAV